HLPRIGTGRLPGERALLHPEGASQLRELRDRERAEPGQPIRPARAADLAQEVRVSGGYQPPGIATRLRQQIRKQGLRPVATEALRWTTQYVAGHPRRGPRRRARFVLGGTAYPYLAHPYNWT